MNTDLSNIAQMNKSPHRHRQSTLIRACVLLSVTATATAADKPEPYAVDNQWFKLQLVPRSSEQMTAFYEGREFPEAARKIIAEHCFITVGMRNHGSQVVWLDLSQWRFFTDFGPVRRVSRDDWHTLWRQTQLPLAQQATFGWTLLPEQRNLLPSEPVGGNLTFIATEQPFTLEADFALGAKKDAGHIKVRIDNVQCNLP